MLINAHITRQLDLIPVDSLTATVNIIGAGAIGSFMALQLAKMGMTRIKVWDMDEVSVENMSCQFFRFSDIGKNKALALKDLVRDFTGTEIESCPRAWTPVDKMTGIVVAAVDDMKVRVQIFEACGKMLGVDFVVDTRMGAETALLYVMRPHLKKDVEAYGKTLYSNEDAVQEKCTAKSTIYTANMISGMAVKAVKNLICKQEYPRVTQWSIASNEMMSYAQA